MNPQDALNHAIQRHQSGDIAGAETIYRQILAENPQHAEALHLLGVAEYQTGRLDDATRSIQAAISINPSNASFYCNLGLVFSARRAFPQAVSAFEHCLRMEPLAHEALFNLGNALRDIGRLADSIGTYQRCLQLQPKHIGSLNNMAGVLRTVGRLEESAAISHHVIAIAPRQIAAYNNLGNTLNEQGRLDEAIDCFRRALAVQADHPQALSNLGNGLLGQGKSDEALLHYDRALAVRPNVAIASNRLFSLQFNPDFDAPAILRESRKFDEQYALPLATAAPELCPVGDRRLRIGYVCPNFREHVFRFLTTPVLANHDRERFEIFAYSDTDRPDRFTEISKSVCEHWRDVGFLDDVALDALIRADKIDILVDINMHMSRGRLLVFARKPAPIQVTWLAYPGTTGLSAIDYRLTDPYLDPPGANDELYSEKSIRLPNSFWCYDPEQDGAPAPASSPPVSRNGHITFGCLNNFCKVNPPLLRLWSRVLNAVRDSRMIIMAPAGEARAWASRVFEQQQIDLHRIDFVPHQSRVAYLDEYNRIDICLDTLPYNGHTTSLDALWMGVPVVTRMGHTIAGRAGFSQLSDLNLTELVGHDDEQFVRIAVELAADVTRISELRQTLRLKLTCSPIMDAARFADDIEAAYLEMARKVLSEEQPAMP